MSLATFYHYPATASAVHPRLPSRQGLYEVGKPPGVCFPARRSWRRRGPPPRIVRLAESRRLVAHAIDLSGYHHPQKPCCSLSASQATPHTPRDAPQHSSRSPPASGSPAPLHDLHNLSVDSPPSLQNSSRTRLQRINSRRRRPSSASPQPSRYAAITTPPSGFRGPTAGAVTETRR